MENTVVWDREPSLKHHGEKGTEWISELQKSWRFSVNNNGLWIVMVMAVDEGRADNHWIIYIHLGEISI